MNLDTLVATEGMGWPAGYNFGNDGQRFTPSTNIAHAHMFRDKVLWERPWCVESECWTIEGKQWFRVCITHRLTEEMICSSFVAYSECEALCLAFLRALGVSEERIKEALDGKA